MRTYSEAPVKQILKSFLFWGFFLSGFKVDIRVGGLIETVKSSGESMYKNILIATDGSEFADKAVTEGLALAEVLDASVKLVTVTEPLSALEISAGAEGGVIDVLDDYHKGAEREAKNILSTIASTAKYRGLTCETIHVSDQHPAEGIIASANDKKCDLIIMASHGRRGIKKFILGSVANEVVSHATIPVLIIR